MLYVVKDLTAYMCAQVYVQFNSPYKSRYLHTITCTDVRICMYRDYIVLSVYSVFIHTCHYVLAVRFNQILASRSYSHLAVVFKEYSKVYVYWPNVA